MLGGFKIPPPRGSKYPPKPSSEGFKIPPQKHVGVLSPPLTCYSMLLKERKLVLKSAFAPPSAAWADPPPHWVPVAPRLPALPAPLFQPAEPASYSQQTRKRVVADVKVSINVPSCPSRYVGHKRILRSYLHALSVDFLLGLVFAVVMRLFAF